MQINLKKIIEEKNPKLHKKLPNFLYRVAMKALSLDKVNKGFKLCGDAKNIDFIKIVLNDVLKIERECIGFDNIPDGEYIFVANHPLGGIDGMSLLEIINSRFMGVKSLSNDIMLHIEPMKELFLPINKHGRQSVEYSNGLNNHLANGKPLLTFPAGLCSRKVNGEITDLTWNKNYIRKAIEHKRAIVPIYVDARNSRLFYNIEVLRRKLKIKLNIGMLMLPREFFELGKKGTKVRLIFGKPIAYEELTNGNSIHYWNSEIRKRCYALKS